MRGISLGDEGVESRVGYTREKLNNNMFDKNLIYLRPRKKNHKS